MEQGAEPVELSPEVRSIADVLRRGSANSSEEFDIVRTRLMELRVPELIDTARLLNVRLTGAGKKAEIVERLITMALIDAIRKIGSDSADAPSQLTYITEDVHRVLGSLPAFDAVAQLSKEFGSVVKEFHFMNVLTYLVYGRDKTFDMESMRAFRSLKGYRFFAYGFVKMSGRTAFCPRNVTT